jgi:hypothetical protein
MSLQVCLESDWKEVGSEEDGGRKYLMPALELQLWLANLVFNEACRYACLPGTAPTGDFDNWYATLQVAGGKCAGTSRTGAKGKPLKTVPPAPQYCLTAVTKNPGGITTYPSDQDFCSNIEENQQLKPGSADLPHKPHVSRVIDIPLLAAYIATPQLFKRWNMLEDLEARLQIPNAKLP